MLKPPAWAKKARKLGCLVDAAAKVVVAPADDPLLGRSLQQPQKRIVGARADAEPGLDVGEGVDGHVRTRN